MGLAILAVSLVGAAGTSAAAHQNDADLNVTAEGVSFDRWHVSRDASLEYTIRPLDGDNSSYVRRYLSGSEWHDGWAALHEAPDRYPDGYCVAWLRLDRYDWGEWMDGPTCWEPEEPAPTDAEEPGGESDDRPGAEPTPPPAAAQESPPAAGARETPEADPEPEPTPATPEPTPEPTPSLASPSPSASPSAEPRPSLSSNPNDPASAIIRSFGGPASADDETGGLPQAAGLIWMWVVIAGIGATAGGVLLMMFRRPL
ncbi:hypothetical protein [Myceligenerans halotolerans]